MLYEQALVIFGLSTLVGQTEVTLKKKFRELAKKRHTDVTDITGEKSLYTLGETKDAYQILVDKLNDNYIETKVLKTKPTVIMTINEYKDMLDSLIENGYVTGLYQKLESQDLKLSINTKVLIESTNTTWRKLVVVSANTAHQYTIGLWVSAKVGDTIQLSIDGCFEIKIKLLSPVFSIKVPMKIEGSMTTIIFNVSVRLSDNMEVKIW